MAFTSVIPAAFTGAALKVVKNVPVTETAVNGGAFVEASIDMGTFVTMPACAVLAALALPIWKWLT